MNKILKYIIAVAACATGLAQQPQTHIAPLSAINAKYVNGVAPGYQVLAGSGLNLSLGPGTSFCSGTIQQFAGATITLTANTTNNIYLNTTSSCSPSVKSGAFTATDIPIAQVVTGASAITTITDLRTMFVTPSQGSGGASNFTQLAGNLGVAQGPTGITGIVYDAGGTLRPAVPGTEYALPNQNTTGTAANLSGTPALPNGVTATTQSTSDGSQKLATDAYVQAVVALGTGHSSVGSPGAVQVAATGGAFGDSGCTNPVTQNLTCAAFITTGSGAGGHDYTEGTPQTPLTGHDLIQANSVTHVMEISNNADTFSKVLRASDVTTVCIPGAFSSQTDGATVTWALNSMCANSSIVFTAHGGSRTLNLTGVVDGGSYVLYIQQDGTGGEGLTLGTGCTWKVSNGGSGAITPSTGANAVDVLAFSVKGSTCLANFTKNFN